MIDQQSPDGFSTASSAQEDRSDFSLPWFDVKATRTTCQVPQVTHCHPWSITSSGGLKKRHFWGEIIVTSTSPSHSHQQQEMNYFSKQTEKFFGCVLKQHREPWVAPDSVSENQETELQYVSTHSIRGPINDPRKYGTVSPLFFLLALPLNHLCSLDKRRTSNTKMYLLLLSISPAETL